MKNQYLLPWRAALPSWLKCQFRQKEVRFLEYVVSSYVVLIFRCSSGSHFTSMRRTSVSTTHQLVWPGLWSNMKRLMEVGVVLLTSWLKSRQKVVKKSQRIVKKPKKLQKSEKFAKAIGSEERLPKHRSSVN